MTSLTTSPTKTSTTNHNAKKSNHPQSQPSTEDTHHITDKNLHCQPRHPQSQPNTEVTHHITDTITTSSTKTSTSNPDIPVSHSHNQTLRSLTTSPTQWPHHWQKTSTTNQPTKTPSQPTSHSPSQAARSCTHHVAGRREALVDEGLHGHPLDRPVLVVPQTVVVTREEVARQRVVCDLYLQPLVHPVRHIIMRTLRWVYLLTYLPGWVLSTLW